ncbi:MAG: hypothetical protein J6A92_07865 [Lachnospiraceae bacterium]|nr:hypothetical protein [Lachnospiraceae bacterium]
MLDKIIYVFFICIILSVWIVLCILKYRKWNIKRKKCIKHVTVYVSDILSKKTKRGDMVYKPIFVLEEKNQRYKIDSAFYSNLVTFGVGQKVNLLINPQNYKQFLYAENSYNKGMVVDIVCCFIPFVFLIGIILAAFVN